MKNNTFDSQFCINTVILMIVLGVIFVPITNINAETVITNNVKVSSDGSGQNRASVKTTISNVVVENWSATGSGSISYTSEVATSSITTKARAEENIFETARREQLKKLIVQLEALIKMYVSLLAK